MWRALISWLTAGAELSVDLGRPEDIRRHLQRVLDAPAGSSLIIEVHGGGDAFLQFTAGPDVIQIDHPLITAAQMEREAALRRVLTDAGLTPYETPGSNGARFLDCDVPRHAGTAAVIVHAILTHLFQIDSASQLGFIGNGLPSAAAY
jgi:hypothetical protein